MEFLTDFADQAVVLPLVLAVAVTLALQGWRRGALVWFGAVAGTFGAVLVLKIVFMACAPLLGVWDIYSPSGHTAAAAVVLGGLTSLVSSRASIVFPIALMGAAAIGLSRVVLGAHSWPEVLLGGMVGMIGALAMLILAGPPPPLRFGRLAVVAALVVAFFHGLHLPAEMAIRNRALQAGLMLPFCQPSSYRQSANQTLP